MTEDLRWSELAAPRPEAPDYQSGYRPDIDGLRAISILLVVGFHAGIGTLSGGYVGVDVFFVLSGYLITGLLVSELTRTGRISMLTFYARRARRLLPLAVVVISVTMIAAAALVTPLGRQTMVNDARSAALYYANWRFAGQTAAYSDVEVTESLFVHYWSLSIEEQFYLFWPVLILIAWFAIKRTGKRDIALTLLVIMVTVFSLSLLVSALTVGHGADTYYHTHTRVWELAAGAILALAIPRLRLSRFPSLLAGLVGCALIVGAAITYDSATPFPGLAALAPVIGCALLIVAGATGSTWLTRSLSHPTMTYVGRISYAWYLWHWPAIGVALLIASRSQDPPPRGWLIVGALIVSFGLAAASHMVIENPIRRSRELAARPRLSIGLGVALTLTPLTLGFLMLRPVPTAIAEASSSSGIGMSPQEAAADLSALGPPECHAKFPDTAAPGECIYGDPEGDISVALVGDSHAQHWLPALDQAGRDRGWRVIAWSKSSCTAIDVPLRNDRLERDYPECDVWRESVLQSLREEGGVDVVLIGDTYNYAELVVDENGEPYQNASDLMSVWRSGAEQTFDQYETVADRVLMLRDTPWARRNVPDCLSEDVATPERCAFELEGHAWLDEAYVAEELAAGNDLVAVIDLTTAICEADPCPVVTDQGIVKYRDGHHLTQTFSRSLSNHVGDAIAPFLSG